MNPLASPPGSSISAIVFALISLICLVLVAPSTKADETDDAIQDTILSQIEAFANEDKEAAWGFASEGIKQQSGSMETFYNMVRLSYAPVYQASSIEFVERVAHSGFHIQVVRLRGPDGKRWRAVYRMVMNGDQWRIGGVVLKKAPQTI